MADRQVLRDLRALRHDPPGYAKQGARRTMFQSSLNQCEQFLDAASHSGVATKPVQLFYGLSQAGRAIVAASPRVDNRAWQVNGHGLTAGTSARVAADATVTATKNGLFQSVASAIGVEALIPGEPASLRELWPLLPETADVPLTAEVLLPALLFFQDGWPEGSTFARAGLAWIPRKVHDLYGQDPARLKKHFDHYPALRGTTLPVSPPMGKLNWRSEKRGMTLGVEWRKGVQLSGGGQPLMLADIKTLNDLGVAYYKSAEDTLVTPAIGSMATGLHPFLALWAVLLALSSLSRYEPAAWSKMIDIDRSTEANPIEHLLDETSHSVPAAVLHLLTTFR